jgi:hypothetical protein
MVTIMRPQYSFHVGFVISIDASTTTVFQLGINFDHPLRGRGGYDGNL